MAPPRHREAPPRLQQPLYIKIVNYFIVLDFFIFGIFEILCHKNDKNQISFIRKKSKIIASTIFFYMKFELFLNYIYIIFCELVYINYLRVLLHLIKILYVSKFQISSMYIYIYIFEMLCKNKKLKFETI